jgi:ABC-type transport system involved in multi-copper enzyme maturation permease subunit
VSAATPSVPKLEEPGRVTFPRILHSEWTKFRTVRSTVWCMAIGILLTIGVPLIVAAVVASEYNDLEPYQRADDDPLTIALVGVYIAQLIIAVLGVLVITPEYSTGSIRSTLTAVPKRLPVLWAKLLNYAIATTVVMFTAMLVCFFATQAIFSDIPELHISLTDAEVARCVLLSPVYVTMVGIFALALGAIVRNTAAGIGLFAAIFFVLFPLTGALPADLGETVRKYLPEEAGRQMISTGGVEHALTPLAGGLVFAGYCVFAIVIAAVLLRRRDV